MLESPILILEVRAGDGERATTITAAVTADASREICRALSEELDRRRQTPAMSADEVLAFREHAALAARFQPLASLGEHAIVSFSEAEVRACLLELTRYTQRVDGDHFQPPELRERLIVIERITPILWEANAQAAAASMAPAADAFR
jgi:hypothetical protein